MTDGIRLSLATMRAVFPGAPDTIINAFDGVSLLNSSGGKQNIYFNNAAKFNGVVADNMATPINTPGKV